MSEPDADKQRRIGRAEQLCLDIQSTITDFSRTADDLEVTEVLYALTMAIARAGLKHRLAPSALQDAVCHAVSIIYARAEVPAEPQQ